MLKVFVNIHIHPRLTLLIVCFSDCAQITRTWAHFLKCIWYFWYFLSISFHNDIRYIVGKYIAEFIKICMLLTISILTGLGRLWFFFFFFYKSANPLNELMVKPDVGGKMGKSKNILALLTFIMNLETIIRTAVVCCKQKVYKIAATK